MATHNESAPSRRVVPETQNLPKWRLYANFLLRELARMWYGQKSIFDLRYGYDEGSSFWRDFVSLFTDMIYLFGEEHGVAPKEAAKKLIEANRKWLIWHSGRPTFSEPYYEAKWHAIQMLGTELAEKLFDDFDVGVILSFVGYAYTFASKGKLPPYGSFARLQPLEYYEALPVAPWLEDRYYNDEPLPF
jgi:hypothetical protein